MPERDECRDVRLSSGETIRVRGRGGLGPAGVAALGELVEAVRAMTPPPDEGTAELYERIEAARGPLTWREVAGQAGVRFSVLFRIGQGRMPGAQDLAAIEAWLAANALKRDKTVKPAHDRPATMAVQPQPKGTDMPTEEDEDGFDERWVLRNADGVEIEVVRRDGGTIEWGFVWHRDGSRERGDQTEFETSYMSSTAKVSLDGSDWLDTDDPAQWQAHAQDVIRELGTIGFTVARHDGESASG